MLPRVAVRVTTPLLRPSLTPSSRTLVNSANHARAATILAGIAEAPVASVDASVSKAAQVPQTGVSLKDLESFGSKAEMDPTAVILGAAVFLQRELPIRFAHRIKELQSLPFGLAESPSTQRVIAWYKQSFVDLTLTPPPKNMEEERAFRQLITRIYERHGPTLVTMARAVWEFKMRNPDMTEKEKTLVESRLYRYLDRFYTSRIGIRTLIAQHLALHEPRDGYVGVIDLNMRPVEIAREASDKARFMCERTLGEAPEVTIYGDSSFHFPYVPAHLDHILFELTKNSLRAVVEEHGGSGALPNVKIIMSAGEDHEDVVIKVSDEGGGIPRSGLPHIWSYFYTTFSNDFASHFDDNDDFSVDTPLAGLGYGLPLSRLYSKYFGGDLQVMSMEGYGCDAYLHLRNVGDASEPVFDVDEF